jgi:hypothetical protein
MRAAFARHTPQSARGAHIGSAPQDHSREFGGAVEREHAALAFTLATPRDSHRSEENSPRSRSRVRIHAARQRSFARECFLRTPPSSRSPVALASYAERRALRAGFTADASFRKVLHARSLRVD